MDHSLFVMSLYVIIDQQSSMEPHKLITYFLSSLLTYLLQGVLLEKLTDSQLVNKFPTFYGNRNFITSFTTSCSYSEPHQFRPCPHIPLPKDTS